MKNSSETQDIDELIKMSTSDSSNSYENNDSDIDKLIRMSTDETNVQEDESALKKAFRSLSEDVIADTYGDKKTAERVEKSPRKTEAQREKDAEEHSKFIADLAIAASRVPGGLIDSALNLAASPITLPLHVWTGDDYSISTGSDLGEKALHALTDNKMAEFGGKNRSKTSDWMQTIGELASFGGAPAALAKTGKALSGAAKAVGVGSTARAATEKVAENTDQNTKLGRLATVLTSLGVPLGLSSNVGKKLRKTIDSPPEYTKGVSLDAYLKNEELGIPRLISADADLNTSAGRGLAQKTQHYLEKSPELQEVAGKGFDFYRDIFGVKGRDKINPESMGEKIYDLFKEKHDKVRGEANKSLGKVFEDLESFTDKPKSSISKNALENATAEILKNPELGKHFLELNTNERVKFLNDYAEKNTGKKTYKFLDKTVELSTENDPRLVNSNAIIPSKTIDALKEIYKDKEVPSKVKELFKVLEKNDGLTSLEQIYEWKKDFTQAQKKLQFDKEITADASKYRIGKINEAVNSDIDSRLKHLDTISKTSRAKEFEKYNKGYSEFFEEMSPETIRELHKNSNSTIELFKTFTNALTEKQSSNSSKMKASKDLNKFYNNMPKDVKKSIISELIFELGFNPNERQWSPNKFKKNYFNMTENQQKNMDKLFSLAHPNSKLSLDKYIDGIHRAGNSLEFRNNSQTAAHMNTTLENMTNERNVQKAVKSAFKNGNLFSLGAHAASAAATKLHRLLRKKYIDKNYQSGETYNKAIQKRIDYEQKSKAGKYDFNTKDFLQDLLIGITANK